MRYDFVTWLCNNHKTISILWGGITTITQLFLDIYFPQTISLPTELSNSSGYYEEAELDVKWMYDFLADARDAIEMMNSSDEDKNEEFRQEKDDNSDHHAEGNETETMIDGIEAVDEIQDEEYSTDVEVLEEEKETETEEKTISTEEAIELFESYYYSHGQHQELSEEISAY